MKEQLKRKYPLAGGLDAVITDETCHYFGGYYHVRMSINIDVPVNEDSFESILEFENAVMHFGKTIHFNRLLEKMAVPEQDLSIVKMHLIKSFEENLLPYLDLPAFGSGFVKSRYRSFLNKSVPGYQR